MAICSRIQAAEFLGSAYAYTAISVRGLAVVQQPIYGFCLPVMISVGN